MAYFFAAQIHRLAAGTVFQVPSAASITNPPGDTVGECLPFPTQSHTIASLNPISAPAAARYLFRLAALPSLPGPLLRPVLNWLAAWPHLRLNLTACRLKSQSEPASLELRAGNGSDANSGQHRPK